jgi:hypothetical protein
MVSTQTCKVGATLHVISYYGFYGYFCLLWVMHFRRVVVVVVA